MNTVRFLSRKALGTTALIIGLLCVLGIHFFTKMPASADTWLLIFGTIIGVFPVFVNAGRSLWSREWASMDTLASIALIFSIIEREWASAVFISLMLAAARLLERATAERMESSIRGLLKLKPSTAKVERNEKTEVIPVDALNVGDIIVVDTGERIAVDGVVLTGEATVDESSLTGESLPVEKSKGSQVSSSTLLSSGSIRIKTTRVGKDTMLERIIALVESSREEKPEIETLGERFGKMYLVLIFFGSAFLLLFTRDVQLVLAVVLVVCADDVAIAIPLTYLRAIGTAAKRGIVIKGGKHLEVLGKVDTVVFDKTGTLTRGRPHVSDIVTADGITAHELLSVSAPAVGRSTHPLSRALLRYAEENGVTADEPERAEVIGGKGIVATIGGEIVVVGNRRLLSENGISIEPSMDEGAESKAKEGKSISFVARSGSVLGFAALGDEVKEGARDTMAALKELGIQNIVMLSGDNERAAGALAEELGINDWHANLLPEEKVAKLKELSKVGIVAMVGDGVNDAAALSIAHVGIAMGALGSDGAIESANIVLMHDDLGAIPDTIRLAHSVKGISIQDFFIWGGSNIIGLALVFTGLIGPAGAAAYNFISDFFPLLNSVRARFPKS